MPGPQQRLPLWLSVPSLLLQGLRLLWIKSTSQQPLPVVSNNKEAIEAATVLTHHFCLRIGGLQFLSGWGLPPRLSLKERWYCNKQYGHLMWEPTNFDQNHSKTRKAGLDLSIRFSTKKSWTNLRPWINEGFDFDHLWVGNTCRPLW